MERWQKDWISRNFSEMIKLTTVTPVFLDLLVAQQVLSRHDVSELERVQRTDDYGWHKASYVLYDILLTRRNAYDILISVLEKTCQVDAANILRGGRKWEDIKCKPEIMTDGEKACINRNLDELVNITNCNISLLESFLSRKQLTMMEIDELVRTEQSKKTKLFYDLLVKRSSYDLLLDVLKEQGQSEAVKILTDGRDTRERCDSDGKRSRLQNFVLPPNGLHQFIESSTRPKPKTMIFILTTLDRKITAEKIQDTMYLPHANWTDSLEFGVPESDPVVISDVLNIENSLSQLLHLTNKERKFVFILTVTSDVVNATIEKMRDCFEITVNNDSISWHDLSHQYQEQLLQRNVIVGSVCRQFQEVLKPLRGKESYENICGQFLIDLINDKTPVIFKNLLPPPPKIYVKRILRSRNLTYENKLFYNSSSDIFVFSGIQRFHLSRLVSRGCATDTSRKQIVLGSLNVQYILLEQTRDFDLICNKTTKPVHWLHYENNKFFWIKSKGLNTVQNISEDAKCESDLDKETSSTDLIQTTLNTETGGTIKSSLRKDVAGDLTNEKKFLTEKAVQQLIRNKQECYNEVAFLDQIFSKGLPNFSQENVCISGVSGIGKSVLLAETGRQILKRNTNTLVIFQEWSQLLGIFETLTSSETDEQKLLHHLNKSTSNNELGENIFNVGLAKGTLHLQLLIDGWDEISPSKYPICRKLLETMKKLKYIRIILTSRPYSIQQCFGDLIHFQDFNILPFTKSEQINFLASYWEEKSIDADFNKLNAFAEKLVTSFKDIWRGIFVKIEGFLPLQCVLIAEIFEHQVITAANPDFTGRIELDIESSPIICLPIELCKILVEKKLEMLCAQDRPIIERWHVREAFRYLECDDIENYLDDFVPANNSNILDSILKIGILKRTLNQERLSFVHATFAEYFVAKYLNDKIHDESPMSDITLKNLFHCLLRRKCKKKTTCKNFLLGNNAEEWKSLNMEIILKLNYLLKYKYDATRGSSITALQWVDVHLETEDLCQIVKFLVENNFSHIFLLFHNWDLFQNVKTNIFNEELLLLAVMNSELGLVKIIADILHQTGHERKLNEVNFKFPKSPPTLLHAAASQGTFPIFNYLIKYCSCSYNNDQTIRTTLPNNLLHECVKDSSTLSGSLITEKVSIIRKLLEIDGSLLESQGDVNYTPVNSPKIHLRLLLVLIESGCRMSEDENNGVNLVSRAVKYMSTQELYYTLDTIPEKELSLLFQKWDRGVALMQGILSQFDMDAATLRLLKKCGVDFDGKCNDNGQSILAWAIIQHRSVDCLQNIYQLGGNTVNVNQHGESVLHVAVQHGDDNALNWVIYGIKIDVNSRDTSGNTPFLSMCSSLNENSTMKTSRMLKLIEHGADILAVNFEMKNALHIATLYGNTKIVDFLLSHGLDVNSRSIGGVTPLHLAVLSRRPQDMVTSLVHFGADVNALNDEGLTALEVALKSSSFNLETVKGLINCIQDEERATAVLKTVISEVNKQDVDSGMSFTVKEVEAVEIASILVKKGASVKSVIEHINRIFPTTQSCMNLRVLEVLSHHKDFDYPEIALLALKQVVCGNYGLEEKDYFDLAEKLVKIVGGLTAYKNHTGETLLHLAVKAGCHRGVEYLLAKGLDADACDNQGNTVLGLALSLKDNSRKEDYRSKIVAALTLHKANENSTSAAKGHTPISPFLIGKMANWERDWIESRWPDLEKLFTFEFLIELHAVEFLTEDELEELKRLGAKQDDTGKWAFKTKLISILDTKENAYNQLLQLMQTSGRVEVYDILEKGKLLQESVLKKGDTSWQRKVVQENLPELIHHLNLHSSFLEQLRQVKLLTFEEVLELERIGYHDSYGDYKAKRMFFDFISNRDFFDKVIAVLEYTKQSHMVEILMEGKRKEIERRESEKDPAPPAFGLSPSSTSHKSFAKIGIEYDKLNVEGKRLTMSLLISMVNHEYSHSGYSQDLDAYKDMMNMSECMKTLGFQVFSYHNISKQTELSKIVDSFIRNIISQGEVDVIMVFVAGHGYNSKILISDHGVIDVNKDIVSKFSNINCPRMAGKLKLFVISACQVKEHSLVVRRMIEEDSEAVIRNAVIVRNDYPRRFHWRSNGNGTIFVNALTNAFKEEARKTSIIDMLKKVQEIVQQIDPVHAEKPLIEVIDLTLENTFISSQES